MKGFLAQCVEKYVELAKIDPKKIHKVDTLFVDVPREDITVATPRQGALQPIASRVLMMKILYASRVGRFDLLKPTCALASRIAKWSEGYDNLLHQLVCYIRSTLDVQLHGWVGDRAEDLWLDSRSIKRCLSAWRCFSGCRCGCRDGKRSS